MLLRTEIVRRVPHVQQPFTQGLLWEPAALWESTGLYGQSTLRRICPTTGAVVASAELPSGLFGEGICGTQTCILQFTWRDGVVLRWDRATCELMGSIQFDNEGWGACFDGSRVITSDGTNMLTFRDPQTLRPIGRISVRLVRQPVAGLNDLEWAEGRIWANVYGSTWVIAIDPATGQVIGGIDGSDLLKCESADRVDVMNGLAWQPSEHHFVFTGKWWSWMTTVSLTPCDVGPTWRCSLTGLPTAKNELDVDL